MADDYLGFLEGVEEQRLRGQSSGIAASSVLAGNVNPDAVGKARATARFLDIPPAAVEANPAEAEQLARVQKIDQDTAAAPTLRQRYTDADFFKLAHDDSGVLGTIESAVRSFKSPGRPQLPKSSTLSIGRSADFAARVQQIKRDQPALDWDTARSLASQSMTVDNQAELIGPVAQPAPTVGNIFRGLINPAQFRSISAGLSVAAADALGMDPAEPLRRYGLERLRVAASTPQFETATGAGLYSGGQSVVQNAPGVALSILLGNPLPGLALAGGASGAQQYGDVRERGGTAGQAALAGGLTGGIEVATELLPMSFLVNKLGKAGAGEFIKGLLAREIPGEQLATLAQDAVDTAIANPNKTWADYLKERPGAAYQTLLATLVQTGVMAGGNTVLERTVMRQQAEAYRADQAAQSAQLLSGLMQAAAASRVRERDAETFAGFMQSATEDGPLEKVYLNPREAQEAGLDLTRLAEVSPTAAAQLQQAAETGADIGIPTSELATLLPGTDLEPVLLQHLKTDPGGFSPASAQSYLQTQGESVRAEVEKVLAEKQNDDAWKASTKAVEDNVRAQLAAANRFTEDVNGPYAAMWAQFFAVQAARLKITPQELFDRYQPRIVSQTAAGALLDQDVPLGQGDPYSGAPDNLMGIAKGKSKAFGEQKYRHVQYVEVTTSSGATHVDAVVGLNEAHAMERARRNWRGAEVKSITEAAAVEQDPTIAEDVKAALAAGELRQNKVDVTRGSFNPDTNTVALLQAADLSTFLHESGHFFLEVLDDLAAEPSAPAEVREDFDAFLRWTGVEAPAAAEGDRSTAAERRAAAWRAMSLEEKRAHHEDFARGFEAYLFEGKAPSLEMQGLFQRFRAWLLNVYRSLQALNVNLNDDIRGVFDRMLATTEQIQLQEDVRGYEALFKNKPEGMSADEWAVYQIQANEATQDAIEELQSRGLRDMRWLANAKGRELKRLQKEAKARRDEVEAEVRAEVEDQPVYKAMAAIREQRRSDPADRTAVKEWQSQRDAEQARLAEVVKAQYLDTPEGKAAKGIERGQFLARSKRQMANEVEAMLLQWEKQNPRPKVNIPEADLAAVAALHGFDSADALRKAIDEAQPLKDVVEGMTDQRMLERFGDLNDERAIERAAEEAIHNDARLRFVATEANALQKATGKPALLAKAVRQFAADIVGRTKVRDLRPSVYTAAERRAAKDATKAMRENRLEDAAIQKRNQLINGHAAKETLSAQAEAQKIADYLRGFNRESLYKSLDADYIDQIHQLLERFDLRNQSLKAIDKRTSLAEWLKSQEDQGLEPEIPPELANEARRTSFKNLTMEELRGLRDTVAQIEHLGRLKHKLLTAKDQRDYEAVRDRIVESIIEHAGDKRADNHTRPTKLDAAVRMFNGYVLEHRKVASLIKELDGFQDGGVMWEYITRTMNEAGDREATMRAEATQNLAELVKPMLEGGKRGGRGQFFPTVGRSFNREERLGIALNMGNAGNIQRLLGGEGWTLDRIKPVLDTLTEADWRFVQSVWDFLETFRPQIAAKSRRVYGKEPDWVEPQPLTVQTADGATITLRGGYYPIKYDPRASERADSHDRAEVAKQMMRGAYASATTRRSFTKARAEEVSGRPLLYSTDALFNGVNEIIHDLSWHEWLIDANRLLRSKSISNAIYSRYGAEVHKQLKDAVQDIAAGEFPGTRAFERGMARLRAGTVIAGMGLNIVNSIINVQGLTQSMVRIGTKWTGVGLAKFAANPRALSREVAGKSEMMANRAKTLNREVNEIQSLVRDKTAARAAADRVMFLPLTITQQVVDLPTWWGAYQKALDEGNADDRAVALADQAVLDAQSGGQVKDLAAIQRGGPLLKLWTTFYGFFNTTYNLTVESTKSTDFKDPMQVVKLATDYLLLWTVPALMGTLLKNLLTGGDWDEEKLAKKAIGDQISYLMGMMVGLRDIAGAAQAATGTNEFNTGYGGPAGARFLGELYKLAQQAHQGNVDMPFFKALNNIGGMLFMYPASQINRTVEGAIALNEGRTSNPLALIAGAPPKQ